MRSMLILAVLIHVVVHLGSASAQNSFASDQPGYPNWSPFTGVRWEADRPIVKVDGKWYALLSISGVSTDDILAACKKNDWSLPKRFEEDLVQVLRLMGHQTAMTVSLTLMTQDGGEVITMEKVKMTEANLREINRTLPWTGNPFLSSVPGYPHWSPFQQVKWENGKPLVQVADKWFTPLSVHGIAVEEILEHSDKQGWDTKRRFSDDLVQIIRLMGKEIDQTTDLVLLDAEGKKVTVDGLQMKSRRPDREQRETVNELSHKELLEDLSAFQTSLQQRFSYLKANDNDYVAQIRAIEDDFPDTIKSDQLAERLQTIMMGFIDGHAGVSRRRQEDRGKLLPVRLHDDGGRIVAVRADRTDLVDSDHPFLVAIDGVKVEDWIEKTSPWIAKGSPQLKRNRGLRLLRSIERFRDPSVAKDIVELELLSRDGKSRRTVAMQLADSLPPAAASWPERPDDGIMEGNVGYFSLPRMNDDAVDTIRQWMPEFRGTIGLIVDVRGNGGGSRSAILELAGYLMSADDEPRIGNVAKYRVAEDRGVDHLSAARYVYRIGSPKFGARERAAIKRFADRFVPEWEPPENEFSQWHYLVLSKSIDDPRYHYQAPVIILMDTDCFSATDIFLSTFKDWPNVTLVGQPSSGGSARTQSFRLPNSGISVRCASMASFQPTGQLYDTHGVIPDVTITQPPEHFLVDGPDAVLDAAKKAIVVATQ